ncbi:MAG: mitochondrial fission ELM1 family protein [Sulfuriferula sp.]
MRRTAWVLSNDIVGMDNQSFGLAEALDLECVKKRVVVTSPWRYLPPNLWLSPLRFLGAGSDTFAPPWPDVVIGTGRLNTAVAVAIKRASGGRTINIRVQHPQMSLGEFDIIAAPQHDGLQGANVFSTLGAVNRVTQARLDDASQKFAAEYADLPRPLIGVLLGGSNRKYKLDADFAERLADQLAQAQQQHGGTVLITPSRRTDVAVVEVLRRRLPDAKIWDGVSENPYFAYLALVDYLVVTADSVNMAGLTGGNNKFEDFHRNLQARGCTRPFTGELAHWQYQPLDETRRVADEIKHRLGW